MILSLLLFVSSFFTTANRGKQKSHDYSRGVQGQGGTKFRSADCVYGHQFLSKKTFIPSKPLRSNACEKQKSHDYSRGVQGQGGAKFRSADCVYGHHFLSKKTFIPSKPLRSNAKENKKATIIVVALNVKEEQSSEVQTASGPKCRLRLWSSLSI